MEYIILERSGDFINVVLRDDGSGLPLVFDDIKTVEEYIKDNLQQGLCQVVNLCI